MMRKTTLFLTVIMLTAVFAANSQTPVAPASGDGSSDNPYQIATLDNLYWLSMSDTAWDKHYKQIADIDAGSTSAWDAGNGFNPIGNAVNNFTGTYNGASHSIDSLSIYRSSTNFVGLFGYIYSSTIDSLGVTNVDINGRSNIGGLVGTSRNLCFINNCYSTGSVNGVLYYVGGLVGENIMSSTIINSYSTANVKTGYDYVGGLVGINTVESVINNSYSTGSSNGLSGVGGFVGRNHMSSQINNCYCTGSPSGSSDVGGFIGSLYNSTTTNSFWDTQTSGQETSIAGIGKTTAEMKTLGTYVDGTEASWDFLDEITNGINDYWGMNPSENNGYPFLAWQGFTNTESCCAHEDNIDPVLAVQDFIVQLDANGNATITGLDVVTNATDNCAIADTTLSQSTFDCSNVGTPVNIDVTLNDSSGNSVVEQAIITVEDNISPTITCIENQIVTLSQGQTEYTISGTEFDPVATDDNCGIASIINDYNSLASLDGATMAIGTTTINWTVTDDNGNTENCNFDLQVDTNVGKNSYVFTDNITIYPNPAQDFVFIESEDMEIKSIVVLDITGKTVEEFIVSDNRSTIDFSNRPEGFYMIGIRTNQGLITKRIMIE